MVVDFEWRKWPAMDVICTRWKGSWNEKRIRSEFEGLARWAKAHKVRTGRWIFTAPAERTFEVCLEVKGRASSEGTVRRRRLPAATVASVEFDPNVVSPRVVYHGLTDWLRARKKEKEIRSVGQYREVYRGNPWTDKSAWAHTSVQVVVRK
jgi:hypothetical protein